MLLYDNTQAFFADNKKHQETIWDKVLCNLKSFIEPVHFNNWFAQLKYIKINNNILFISAPNHFTRDWIINNFFILIKKEVYKINVKIKKIAIVVQPSLCHYNNNHSFFLKLSTKYIFKNFYICHENILAHKISTNIYKEISQNQHYNIYFFHANIGMGKTHLLQAIAASLRVKLANYRVEYLSAEKFMCNFVYAIKNNTLFELRKNNTNIDIYIIDDFHFIHGKESTQKEFSFIMNSLIEEGKTVIIASTIPPYLLELNDQRTKSLLIASNVIYIKKLGIESRLQLLECFNRENPIRFHKEILKLLANKIKSNIRELEASIKNLTTYLMISQKKPTTNNIYMYIQDHIRCAEKKVFFNDILNTVVKFYRITKNDIVSKKRDKHIILARMVIVYLSKEMTSITLKNIGIKLGNRNHATVLYYINKYIKIIANNKDVKKEINIIKNSLRF